MTQRVFRAIAVGAVAFLSACTSGEALDQTSESVVAVCPEGVRISARGNPIGLVSGHIRWCWPGEAKCFCDRDNDCYAEEGYVPCTPPAPDAGAADASTDVVRTDATTDASTDVVRTDAATDAATDVVRADATTDASTDVVRTDATTDASVADASTVGNVCPEGVRISARGNPIGLVSGHIRWCWPGEARCYCDADSDCYAQAGYVPCTPPGAGADAATATDAAGDTGVRDAAVSTDAGGTADTGATADAVVSTDAGPLAADNPVYTGALSTATGSYRGSLTVAGERRDVWVHVPTTRPTRPALVIAFHGTNADGNVVMTDANLRTLANNNGFVVMAPTSRWFGGEGGDFDHPGGNGTYWETRNTDPNTNPDLVLTRAIMVEAQARYNVDPDRIYVLGHSNGGFMSLLVSVALRDRIAAFAENSAGQVTCADRPSCSFQGSGTTCAGLATQSGWCGCSGYAFPTAVPTSGRRVPGYLAHGAQDPMVSVFYTCALGANLSAAGGTVEVAIRSGGHDLPASFGAAAWSFFSRFRR